MNKPTLTIGLPGYNREDYLEEFESILTQDFSDYELLISDNASTDSTGDICPQFTDRDRRVRYTRHIRNIGTASKYNSRY